MLSPTIRTRIRTAQLLTAVLASGVVVMTVVMTLVVQQGATGATGGTGGTGAGNGIGSPPGGSAHGPMLIMLAVFSVTLLPMAYLVVPMIRMKTARVVWGDAPAEVDAPERLAGPWMTYVIISAAMAESVGLFGAVVYMITGRAEALAAPAAAVVAMLLAFPTEGRFLSFVRSVTGRDTPGMEAR